MISSYGVDDGVDDGIFTDLTKALRFFLREHQPEHFQFDPGRIVATIGVMKLIKVGPMHHVSALDGQKVWIITEPGVTTILLPQEY